jgi:hypothetical protein
MATFRKRGPYQWQAQVRKKGQPLQSKTFETRADAERWARLIEVEMDKGVFVSRAEAEATPLNKLLERYLLELTPLKKGAEPESIRLRAFMRHPLALRMVAGIRGVDIARFRDERLWLRARGFDSEIRADRAWGAWSGTRASPSTRNSIGQCSGLISSIGQHNSQSFARLSSPGTGGSRAPATGLLSGSRRPITAIERTLTRRVNPGISRNPARMRSE